MVKHKFVYWMLGIYWGLVFVIGGMPHIDIWLIIAILATIWLIVEDIMRNKKIHNKEHEVE